MPEIDEAFGSLRDSVEDWLGGAQLDVSLGGGAPAGANLTVGEHRVMSGWALFGVFVIGLLAGAAFFGGR